MQAHRCGNAHGGLARGFGQRQAHLPSECEETVSLRDWLTEFDPGILRVGGINLYRDNCAGLHAGHMDDVYEPINCYVVGLVARNFHPESNPKRVRRPLGPRNSFHR